MAKHCGAVEVGIPLIQVHLISYNNGRKYARYKVKILKKFLNL